MKRGTFYSIVVASLAASLATVAHEAEFKHLHGTTNPATPLKLVPEKESDLNDSRRRFLEWRRRVEPSCGEQMNRWTKK